MGAQPSGTSPCCHPRLTQEILSQTNISQICLWNTITLFFASFFKLSVKKIFSFAWSLGHQGKDKISLQTPISSLYLFVACLSNKQLT